MFNKQSEKGGIKDVETIIGLSVKVKGNFHCQGNIVVEGILEGSLKTEGELYVGDNAKVIANIEAKEAIIGGEINGNIKIQGYLKISSTAKIFGDIECGSLSIEQGGLLNGKCSMAGGSKSRSVKQEKTIEETIEE